MLVDGSDDAVVDTAAQDLIQELAAAPVTPNLYSSWPISNTLLWALHSVKPTGLYMEFGVFSGKSITQIAKHNSTQTVYGFDSFQGLPQDWHGPFVKGYFSTQGRLPPVPANVELFAGWFEDTLATFLQEHCGPVAFVHMDADLYSSTAYVLEQLYLHGRLQVGAVFVFDELMNYNDRWCYDGEFKALLDFLQKHPEIKIKWSCRSATPSVPPRCTGDYMTEQAAFKVVSCPTPS